MAVSSADVATEADCRSGSYAASAGANDASRTSIPRTIDNSHAAARGGPRQQESIARAKRHPAREEAHARALAEKRISQSPADALDGRASGATQVLEVGLVLHLLA